MQISRHARRRDGGVSIEGWEEGTRGGDKLAEGRAERWPPTERDQEVVGSGVWLGA
jgi:hypothetical protein